eukprot:TRINITY_DN61688_c0_g1_i1.p1 TRINITY_DN61688_c0_g1~~TRINITY_DN61688_c0_g1_i1.p1  ORF type:complete len:1249 (-),score=262.57 TRINITY_DN61688_c0_g1_i1:45-3791(-)
MALEALESCSSADLCVASGRAVAVPAVARSANVRREFAKRRLAQRCACVASIAGLSAWQGPFAGFATITRQCPVSVKATARVHSDSRGDSHVRTATTDAAGSARASPLCCRTGSSRQGSTFSISADRFATGLFAAATISGVASLRRKRRGRRGGVPSSSNILMTLASAAAATPTSSLPLPAPTVPAQPLNTRTLYTDLSKRIRISSRLVASSPTSLPMPLLSIFTALPVLAGTALLVCPSKAVVARSLAGSLGALLGTMVGGFFERTKLEAARCSVLRILAEHLQATTSTAELRALVEASRQRFAVAPGDRKSEAFEDSVLQDLYLILLTTVMDRPSDATDLLLLRRLKVALDLDDVAVGMVHRQAAQSLASRGYTKEDVSGSRTAADKLLFLSERVFADEESEEARMFEFGRVRKALRISDAEARQRATAFARTLYKQALRRLEVDANTAETLVSAPASFGLDNQDAAHMNVEAYGEIAANLVADDQLSDDGRLTLERARQVLQLSEEVATAAYIAVAAPLLRQDACHLARRLRSAAASTTSLAREELAEAVRGLKFRCEQLSMQVAAAEAVVVDWFAGELKILFVRACRETTLAGGNDKSLRTLDELLAFVAMADDVLAALHAAGVETSVAEGRFGFAVGAASSAMASANEKMPVGGFPLTYPADIVWAKRLYGLYLSRSLDDEAAEGSRVASELARVLKLSAEDERAARIETCQPRLQGFYLKSLEGISSGKVPVALAKLAVEAELERHVLPVDAVRAAALEAYRARVTLVSDKMLKASEKDELDVERAFLDLTPADIRKVHLRSFGLVYERYVDEAMGRSGAMAPETTEALEQLRERFGLDKDDAAHIFRGVVKVRLKGLMKGVKEAWEEATYTKEALIQVYKQRGQDVGDDPSADGTGAELGIKESVPLDGVRGFKFMDEASKVVDFYVNNRVFPEGATPGEEKAYPVTVGSYLEDKVKEEMFGIFAWNEVTCQDSFTRAKWARHKPHIGGILGLSSGKQQEIMCRMVSRWCNSFIKQRLQESGQLSEEDISTLTDWAPTFFGIDKDLTREMVQVANRKLLQSKALQLLNMSKVTAVEVQKLRDEIAMWDLSLLKDLELTKPQLRSMFRIQVSAALEDPSFDLEQKQGAIEEARDGFGLGSQEASEELSELLRATCKGCLVNACGDLMQGQTEKALVEMRRLELLAAFARDSGGIDVRQEWEVTIAMRRRLVQIYGSSVISDRGANHPDVKLLERLFGLTCES